jgi:hypothetical protein
LWLILVVKKTLKRMSDTNHQLVVYLCIHKQINSRNENKKGQVNPYELNSCMDFFMSGLLSEKDVWV